MRQVIRTAIPVDDEWHVISMTGQILHVAARDADIVEIWHIHDDGEATPTDRLFRVVGTGAPLAPALARHVGTAISPSGNLVWHLFEHG